MLIDRRTGILRNEAVHREMPLLYCPQIPKAHREMYIVPHALLLTSETP